MYHFFEYELISLTKDAYTLMQQRGDFNCAVVQCYLTMHIWPYLLQTAFTIPDLTGRRWDLGPWDAEPTVDHID